MNYIRLIELWIVNLILSLSDIPDAVQVTTLADDESSEGVIDRVANIRVSYSGSSSRVSSLTPLVLNKDLSFEITYVMQDYMSRTGHTFATDTMLAVERSINGKSPIINGGIELQVESPFYVSSDNFEGITDNSQYVYKQSLSISVNVVVPETVIDPCVQRGNCGPSVIPEDVIFPGDIEDLPPGSVITPEGVILLPCPPENSNVLCDPRTYIFEEDLYLCDGTLLIEGWSSGEYSLILRNKITDSSPPRWRVDVFSKVSQSIIKSLSYCQSKWKLAQAIGELWNSRIGELASASTSALSWSKSFELQELSPALLSLPSVFSQDPLNESSPVTTVADGKAISFYEGIEINVFGNIWYKVTVNGVTGWLLSPNGTADFILPLRYSDPCEDDPS